VSYCSDDLDDLFARLGGIEVLALKARERRNSLKESNLIRFVCVCAFHNGLTATAPIEFVAC
jgi:hypothetical protein